MELISCFDDGLFDNSDKSKDSDNLLVIAENYTPKQCPEDWFYEDDVKVETKNDILAIKFRADSNYFREKFKEAIADYEEVLSLLERTNFSLKRDCVDGIIRSLIKLKNVDEALIRLDELIQLSRGPTQFCSVWKLASEIHRLKHNYKDEIDSLMLLLNRYPANYIMWLQLAIAMANLYNVKTCFNSLDNVSKLPEDNEKNTKIIAACLIRIRILLDSVENNPQFLNFKKKEELKFQVLKQLQDFGLSPDFMRETRTFMSRNMIREEQSDVENLSNLKITEQLPNSTEDSFLPSGAPSEFISTWFGWIDSQKQSEQNIHNTMS